MHQCYWHSSPERQRGGGGKTACLSGFCVSKSRTEDVKCVCTFNTVYYYIQTCILVLIEQPWRIWLFLLSLRLDVSHGDPLAVLAELPCFPLKSHSAVVLLGAMQVNISISIESVLFWRSSVFLGSSALTQLRLGSSAMCFRPHPLHHTPAYTP